MGVEQGHPQRHGQHALDPHQLRRIRQRRLLAAPGAAQGTHAEPAEEKHAAGDNAEAKAMIAEARALIDATPVDDAQSLDPEFNAIFTAKREKETDEIGERQAEVESRWDATIVENYRKAKELADKAAAM